MPLLNTAIARARSGQRPIRWLFADVTPNADHGASDQGTRTVLAGHPALTEPRS